MDHARSSSARTPVRHRALALALALLVGPLSPGAPLQAPAAAQTGEADDVRAGVEEDLHAATAEVQRVAAALAAAEAERGRLDALLADVERRTVLAAGELEAAEGSLGRASAELRTAEARLRITERQLEASLAELRDQAVDSFIVGGSRDETIGVLLEAEDLRELGAAATYRDVVLEGQDRIVDRVERLKLERVRATEAAHAARIVADEAVTAAMAKRASLDAERSELQVLKVANARAVYTHALVLQQVQALKVGYEAQLAALAQVSDSVAAELAARQVGQVAGPAVPGTFAVPVAGRLSSDFGPRVHPIFGGTRLHAGIDVAAPVGTPTVAAGAGTVVSAGPLGGYGNAVVIDHGAGLSTLYGHLSAVHVAAGAVVARDQPIAEVGSTGSSTGPHLHFEVRLFGTPVDPAGYL